MGLTAWGLVRMEINETYKAFLGVGWLYLITCTFTGYEPTALRLGPLTRLGGRMSAANVAFDDHPDAKRFTDRIETVTVDSVFSWMNRTRLGGAPVVLRLP